MDGCLKDGTEPKAPDKNLSQFNDIDNCKVRSRYDTNQDSRRGKVYDSCERKTVLDLDEPGLRALLDEAFSYKNPKDAQGKSALFKELLQSVEEDTQSAIRASERSSKPKRSNKKEAEKSYYSQGSLQDLNNVGASHTAHSEGECRAGEVCSLPWKPAGVKPSPSHEINIQDILTAQNSKEPNCARHSVVENGGYEDTFNTHRATTDTRRNCPPESSPSTSYGLSEIRRTLSSGCLEDENYTDVGDSYKSASLSLGAPSHYKDEFVAHSSRESYVDKASKNCDENANSLSVTQERKGKCRRLKARNDKNTILSEHIEGHRSDIAQDIDAVMKYIESPTRRENKNSRPRMSFQKTSRITNKLRPVRDKSSDTVRKGRKSKTEKFQKSSSLEEVCISTFEELTSRGGEGMMKNSNSIVNNAVGNTSYSEEIDVYTSQYGCSSSNSKTAILSHNQFCSLSPILKKDASDNDADSEFHTVKKKQRKKKNPANRNPVSKVHSFTVYSSKKQFTYPEKERDYYPFERHISRRKSTSSVPSSEKSEDSSDGDSVHSLPASTQDCGMYSLGERDMKNASYAAIARAAPSPSRIVTVTDGEQESGEKNISSSDEPVSPESIPTVMVQLPARKDKSQSTRINEDDYPPLNRDSSNDMYVEFTLCARKKENVVCESVVNVEKTVIVKLPLARTKNSVKAAEKKLVSGKKPAVIICDPICSPCDVKDLEFGFEINQQLLEEGHSSSEEALEENPSEPWCQPVPEEMLANVDPVRAYLLQEWNSVVEELDAQNAGGPVTVLVVDC